METLISTSQLLLVPVVMAVVQIIKLTNLTGTDNRWAPAWSLALGIVGAFLLPSATVAATVLAGVVIGASAAGVYSAAKTTFS